LFGEAAAKVHDGVLFYEVSPLNDAPMKEIFVLYLI